MMHMMSLEVGMLRMLEREFDIGALTGDRSGQTGVNMGHGADNATTSLRSIF